MKKVISVSIIVMFVKSVFALSPIGTYVLFQPNPQISYLHFLRFDDGGDFFYYECTISNMQNLSVSLTDSVFGKWFQQEKNVYLYSDRYLESESNEVKNLYRILPVKSLMGDSLMLTIVDECTLNHPDLYRQFKCSDSIIPNLFDKKILYLIVCNLLTGEKKEDALVPNDPNDK